MRTLTAIAAIILLLSLSSAQEAKTTGTSNDAKSSSKTSQKSKSKKKAKAAPPPTAPTTTTNVPVTPPRDPVPIPKVWVNSLVVVDASDVIEALVDHKIAFKEHPSNSALGPPKLVIAFGPAAPLHDIKAVARALPHAYITFVPGDSFVHRIVFVGVEAYDDKKIVQVLKVYEAIAAASDLETLARIVPRSEDPHG